jgi:excisionase family DNA binding protein
MVGTSARAERYTVQEAATRLGIKERAVRRRIATGTLEAERNGKRWWVILPASASVFPAQRAETQSALNDTVLDRQERKDAAFAAPETEGVSVSDFLRALKEKDERIEVLSVRLGYVQAELDQAREQMKLLQAPKDEPADEVAGQRSMRQEPDNRSFWQRLKDRAYGR